MGIIITDSYPKSIINSYICFSHNESMKYTEFAGRFRELWQESDLPKTQKELAKKLKCSQPMVNYWLNGEKLPSMETAIRLSGVFRCNVEWFLTGSGPKRQGEQIQDDLYNEIIGLPQSQRHAIKTLVSSLSEQNPTQAQPAPLDMLVNIIDFGPDPYRGDLRDPSERPYSDRRIITEAESRNRDKLDAAIIEKRIRGGDRRMAELKPEEGRTGTQIMKRLGAHHSHHKSDK
jgi:transcriptional regulator with XRE-family HTH domain